MRESEKRRKGEGGTDKERKRNYKQEDKEKKAYFFNNSFSSIDPVRIII